MVSSRRVCSFLVQDRILHRTHAERAVRAEEPRRPARGPVSPVAPRRTAVAAVLRSADHGLPYDCAAHIGSLVSFEGLPMSPEKQSRWGGRDRHPSGFTAALPTLYYDRTFCACGRSPGNGGSHFLAATGSPLKRSAGSLRLSPLPGASSPLATEWCPVTGEDGCGGVLYLQPVPLLPTEAQVSPAFSCLKRYPASPARKRPAALTGGGPLLPAKRSFRPSRGHTGHGGSSRGGAMRARLRQWARRPQSCAASRFSWVRRMWWPVHRSIFTVLDPTRYPRRPPSSSPRSSPTPSRGSFGLRRTHT